MAINATGEAADDAGASLEGGVAMRLQGIRAHRNYSEKVRLFTAKAAVWLVAAGVLFVHHAYREDGLPNLLFELTGSGMLFLAAIGRIWSAGYIAGKKNVRLIQDGPYSVMRHPLYFFSFLGFLGAGLAMESLVLTGTLVAIFFFTHLPVVRREEERLHRLFGEEYARYARGVPAIFPKPWLFRCPTSVELQCRAFNRAVCDAALIGLIFMGTETLEWCHLHGIIPILLRLY
ncbi:methyltransferase family protein [Thermopirellula anaerolimosa]